MKAILISVLGFEKKDLTLGFMTSALPGIANFLAGESDAGVRLVLTENSRSGLDCLDEARKLVAQSPLSSHPRFQAEWIRNPDNHGFGRSHNETFGRFPSDFLVILNNDLRFESETWLSVLLDGFARRPTVALVGLENAPRYLSDDGSGRDLAPTGVSRPDYAEGSILAVRSEVARKIGLFADDLQWAYFEDSDLGLRFRKAGYEIDHVPIPHEHLRGSGSSRLGKGLIQSIHEKNRSRFLARWSRYLSGRTFEKKILVDLATDGIGDCLLALPAVHGLLRQERDAEVTILLSQPSAEPFFALDRVKIVRARQGAIDDFKETFSGNSRSCSLADVNFASTSYIGCEIAASFGADFAIEEARGHLRSLGGLAAGNDELSRVTQPKAPYAVLHAEYDRPQWEGRGVPPAHFVPVIERLRARGISVVLVGTSASSPASETLGGLCEADYSGKLSLLGLNALIIGARYFVGFDSGPLHFAQLLGIPSFAFFGATLPQSRLLDLQNSHWSRNESLGCLGCYHLQLEPEYNVCIRRDEACLRAPSAADLARRLDAFLDGAAPTCAGILADDRRIRAWHREIEIRSRPERVRSRHNHTPDSLAHDALERYSFLQLMKLLRIKVGRMTADRIFR